jgi:hypothetical protein
MLSIALSSLGATNASASCGDYLHHAMADVPTSSESKSPNKPGPSRPAIPCTGPACQNAPAIPDMPTSVDVRFSFTERLAVESGWLMSLLEAGGQQVLCTNLVVLPEGHRAGLERPPRPA